MKWKDLNSGYEGRLERLRNAKPHEILEVPEDASLDEIKNAYRKKISISHPDRSSSFMKSTDEEITKIINQAYEELRRRKAV